MFTTQRLICLLLAAGSLSAHDLYPMPERFHVLTGETVTIALHDGDAFPDSEVSAPLERVRDAFLRAASGSAAVSHLRVDGKRALGDVSVPGKGDLLLTLRTIPNFIELKPEEFLSYLKEEGLTHVIDWRTKYNETSKPGRERYSKYAKSILTAGAPGEEYRKPAGLVLEIVTLRNPALIRQGETLPVQVLFRGAPAASLQLEAAWAGPNGTKVQVAGQTDSQGRLNVPIASNGKWRLHTLRMERCAEPAVADWESYWSSLTFEIR